MADEGHKSNHLSPYERMQLDTKKEQICLTRINTGGQGMNTNCHNNDNITVIQKVTCKNPNFIKMVSSSFKLSARFFSQILPQGIKPYGLTSVKINK